MNEAGNIYQTEYGKRMYAAGLWRHEESIKVTSKYDFGDPDEAVKYYKEIFEQLDLIPYPPYHHLFKKEFAEKLEYLPLYEVGPTLNSWFLQPDLVDLDYVQDLLLAIESPNSGSDYLRHIASDAKFKENASRVRKWISEQRCLEQLGVVRVPESEAPRKGQNHAKPEPSRSAEDVSRFFQYGFKIDETDCCLDVLALQIGFRGPIFEWVEPKIKYHKAKLRALADVLKDYEILRDGVLGEASIALSRRYGYPLKQLPEVRPDNPNVQYWNARHRVEAVLRTWKSERKI